MRAIPHRATSSGAVSGSGLAWKTKFRGKLIPGDAHFHAFLFADGVMTDLSMLPQVSGWTDLHPMAINDLGQIVGAGRINEAYHAFFLDPIPEPETYAMMLVGLGVLGAVARRRKTQ